MQRQDWYICTNKLTYAQTNWQPKHIHMDQPANSKFKTLFQTVIMWIILTLQPRKTLFSENKYRSFIYMHLSSIITLFSCRLVAVGCVAFHSHPHQILQGCFIGQWITCVKWRAPFPIGRGTAKHELQETYILHGCYRAHNITHKITHMHTHTRTHIL